MTACAARVVYLVGCCAEKLPRPAPARELYRSALFTLARAYAEGTGSPWLILSARHHVVQPNAQLSPYDQRMPTRAAHAAAWGERAAAQLLAYAGDRPTRFVSLCGAGYTRHLARAVQASGLHTLEHPLAGMRIGRRLQWLKQHSAARQRAPSSSF